MQGALTLVEGVLSYPKTFFHGMLVGTLSFFRRNASIMKYNCFDFIYELLLRFSVICGRPASCIIYRMAPSLWFSVHKKSIFGVYYIIFNPPGVKVVGVESDGREVKGVNTDHGYISCGTLINCTGMWGWEMGQLSRPPVTVPLHPCNHFYVTTGPVEGVDLMMPVTRDYDARTYLREWSGGLLGGMWVTLSDKIFGSTSKFGQFRMYFSYFRR